jgi:RNA polymerase sigma factor for flagellar operon FliA
MYTENGTLDRNQCIEKFAPMVKRIAHHLMARLPASVQLSDMVQAGLIGLVDAAGRYENSQGVQFETYAAQRIRGAMLDELRAHDWVPRGVRKAQRKIDDANAKLEQKLGRPPLESEIAQYLKIPVEEYREMLSDTYAFQLVHVDEFEHNGEDAEFLDRNCPADHEDPYAKLSDAQFRAALVSAIELLPEREKLLMGLYYEKELNFREIAEVLGVTESRVCQLHSQAVTRLRGKLKDWKGQMNG